MKNTGRRSFLNQRERGYHERIDETLTDGETNVFVTFVKAFGKIFDEDGQILVSFLGCIQLGKELS